MVCLLFENLTRPRTFVSFAVLGLAFILLFSIFKRNLHVHADPEMHFSSFNSVSEFQKIEKKNSNPKSLLIWVFLFRLIFSFLVV